MFRDKNPLQLLYWLIIALFVFLLCFLLVKLFPLYKVVFSFLWKLIAPFFISGLIAYLLYPVIRKLNNHNINKGYAILLIYLLFFGGISYLIYHVYPTFIYQVQDLNEHLPQFIVMYENLIYKIYESTSFLPETVHDKMDDLIVKIESSLDHILGNMVDGFTKVFDLIIILTVIPVIVFYFLKDYHKMKEYFKNFLPKKYEKQVSKLIHAIDESLGNYIRGQLLVSLFISLATLIVFHLLGIKYALLLAIIMGITNLIPYFGPIIGAIPAVALTLTISTKLVVFVIITVLVIQIIENNFLSPYIVGRTTNIHPVGIIFALLLGAQIGGLFGMVFAVPALTIIRTIVANVYAFRQYH